MEFERAIYRVYERCLDGFRDNEGDVANKYCRLVFVDVEYVLVYYLMH